MVINLDQTPSKHVPGCNKIQAPKGFKSDSVAGSTGKTTITATFSITMDGKFLLMQIICSGKTSKSISPVSFPDSFLVSAKKSIRDNEKESLKMLEHIVSVPCLAGHRCVRRPDDETGSVESWSYNTKQE